MRQQKEMRRVVQAAARGGERSSEYSVKKGAAFALIRPRRMPRVKGIEMLFDLQNGAVLTSMVCKRRLKTGGTA